MPNLTVKGVAATKEPGLYGDGGGLYLRIGPTGAKWWALRTVIRGKRRELGLGSVDLVPLAEAREKATAFRKIARDGGDPASDRKAAAEAIRKAEQQALMTFEEAAKRVYAALLPTWKNAKHTETWWATIETYVLPHFGKQPIHTLTSADILKALSPLWTTTPETAKRLRQRLTAIFDWAKGAGHYTGDNPVIGVDRSLPMVKRDLQHLAAMDWREVPSFIADLGDREGISARCLEFTILTAVRSGEARGATWAEIDLKEGAWLIPGERMKRGLPHRVPLSRAALEVLEKVRGLDPVLVFPSVQRGKDGAGKVMSDMVFKALTDRMGREGFTTHGFRSSFRDWCGESAKADPEVAEAALSHATGNAVSRAYARSDLFDRRRVLMDAWAAFATGANGQVVQLVRA